MAIWGVVAAIVAVVGMIGGAAWLATVAERRRWQTREADARTEGERDALAAERYLAEHSARSPDVAFDIVHEPPQAPAVEPRAGDSREAGDPPG